MGGGYKGLTFTEEEATHAHVQALVGWGFQPNIDNRIIRDKTRRPLMEMLEAEVRAPSPSIEVTPRGGALVLAEKRSDAQQNRDDMRKAATTANALAAMDAQSLESGDDEDENDTDEVHSASTSAKPDVTGRPLSAKARRAALVAGRKAQSVAQKEAVATAKAAAKQTAAEAKRKGTRASPRKKVLLSVLHHVLLFVLLAVEEDFCGSELSVLLPGYPPPSLSPLYSYLLRRESQ